MRAFLCVLLLCAGCGNEFDGILELARTIAAPQPAAFEPDDALPPSGELRASYDLTIKSGHHHSDHDFVAKPHLGTHVDRGLWFRATFSADAAYTTQAASNQWDWNKLMGLTTDRIHKNSIRIGWRWNPQTSRIELGYYGYLNGARVMQQLTDVAPGDSIDCELHMTNSGMSARAGAAQHAESGSMGAAFPLTWVLHTAYFGGDETAPHDIHVSVSNVTAL